MPQEKLDTVRLQELVMGAWEAAALMSAVELKLFTAIHNGATTIPDIAAAIDISPANAERLVTVCTAMGLVEPLDGRLCNAPDVDRFLVDGKPTYAGPWMLFSKPRWNEWGRLTEHLKSNDAHVLGMYQEFTVDAARRYHEATYSIGLGAGRRFARQVDLSGRKRIMDLGGGSGAYSIVATQKWPDLKAIVFDLPPVAEVAKEFISANDAAGAVETMGGDFTSDPLPGGCDVAIMASNLPQYSREIIARVIAKAFDALDPGGEMHLIGEMLNDDRSGPIGPALWGLSEALAHSTGVAHSQADCLRYFREAGFEQVKAVPFIERTLTRVTGRKPR